MIQEAVNIAGPRVGFKPTKVSTRSMQSGGFLAFILARVEINTIRLVGRWLSDAMLFYSNHLHRASQQVLRRAWSNTGTMRSSCPTTGDNILYPQGWVSCRPYLGTGGCPGKVSVWHWHINTPFIPNSLILASTSRRKPYNSRSRCSDRDRRTFILQQSVILLGKQQ